MARNRRRGGRPPTIDLNAREVEGERPEGRAGDRPEAAPGAQEGTPTFTTEEGARESHDETALDQPAPAPYSQPGAGEPGTEGPAMHTPPQDTEPATGETQEERAGIASSLDMTDAPQGRPGGPGEDEPPVETPVIDEPPRDGDRPPPPPVEGRRGPGFGSLLLSALLGGALGAGLLYWLLAADMLPRGYPAVAALQGEVESLRGELAAREPAVSPAEVEELSQRVDALAAAPPADLTALQSELESVRAQLAEAPAGSGEAAALNERLSALETRIDAALQDLTARLQAAPGSVDPALAQRLSALETRIAETGAPDAELQSRVEGLATALAGVEELAQQNTGAAMPQALDALATELAGRIDAVQTRLESIDQTTQALQQQAASGAEQRAALEQNLTQSVDELRQTVSSLQSEVETAAQAREALGGELESLRSTTSTLQGTAETLQSDFSGLTGTVEGVQQRLAELGALSGRIDAIDRQIAALDARTSQAEQERQAALALALQGLGRAAEGDAPFAREVETVAALIGDENAVAELREYAEAGVPSRAALAREFDAVARDILAAAEGEAGDGFLSRLGANAQSLVRVRRTGEAQGTGADAIVARMEARLEEGDLPGTLQEWSGLSEEARQASAEWAAAAERRLALDQAIAALGRPDAPPSEPTTRTVPVDVPSDGAAATPTN